MATLHNAVFGSVNGKIGNAVARSVHGKDFISHRPTKYKKTKSPKAIIARSKFATNVKFAKHINSIPELSHVWKNAGLKGFDSYHRLLSYNYKYVGETSPTIDNIILPPAETYYNYNLDITENDLNIGFAPDAFIQNEKYRTSLSIFAILLFNEPIRKGKNNFIIKNAILKDIELNEDGFNNVNIPFEKSISQLITKYKNMVVYLALIIKPKNHSQISWLPMETKSIDLNALSGSLNE